MSSLITFQLIFCSNSPFFSFFCQISNYLSNCNNRIFYDFIFPLFYGFLYSTMLYPTLLNFSLLTTFLSINFHTFFCVYIILFFLRARTYNNLSDNILPFDPGSLRSHTYTEAEIASSSSGELDVISGELERKWICAVKIYLALKRVDGKWRWKE